MSYTAQCQNPLPDGASGSYSCSASDFVPAGTLNHWSSGETLPPVQPNPLRMLAAGKVPLSRSGLVIVNTGDWASESPQQPESEPTASASAADSADRFRIPGFIVKVLFVGWCCGRPLIVWSSVLRAARARRKDPACRCGVAHRTAEKLYAQRKTFSRRRSNRRPAVSGACDRSPAAMIRTSTKVGGASHGGTSPAASASGGSSSHV